MSALPGTESGPYDAFRTECRISPFAPGSEQVSMSPLNLRNIGISAHIDSGKTTLSERILFYAGRIHRMNEVRGDGDGATMDHMDLERERGITITSAATTVSWNDTRINLIDTPGHVDFTIEVERSLRVLDGAVLVLCSVGGVQSQSLTIDRQMRRYGVARLAFINKMDRIGSDPHKVVRQLHEKLHCDAVLMQLPIGKEAGFMGVVDLITREAVYFDGRDGEKLRRDSVPTAITEEVEHARRQMLESLSMYDDELLEKLLAEESVEEELIHSVVRRAVRAQQITPVFLGSAYKNKGIQLLLDAIVRYLPGPEDNEIPAIPLTGTAGEPMSDDDAADSADGSGHGSRTQKIRLQPNPEKPMVGMTFKIVEDPYGALTFFRVYQGQIRKGETYFNQRTGKKERFGRILRMHADEREEIESASAGDIVAVLGIDSISGDTYCQEYPYCTLEGMHVPEPVLRMAIAPAQRNDSDRLGKALAKYRREDPTFQLSSDEETGETIIAGMGELHLEVYVERLRREQKLEVIVGAPKVNYREAPTQSAPFNVRHRKQTGGSGQYAHIVGRFELIQDQTVGNGGESGEDGGTPETFIFEEKIVGGRIPKQYIPAIEKGFRSSIEKGPVAGFPVVGLHVIVEDGSYHEVDSSDLAFQTCARTTMREHFSDTNPTLLEPIMKVEIECPEVFQGNVVGDLTSRRGQVNATESSGPHCRIEGEVPLSETFGYMTALRSMTQGQAAFTMEFARYRPLPKAMALEVITKRREASRK